MISRDEIISIGAIKASSIDDIFITPTTEDLCGVIENILITEEGENEDDR